MTDDRIASIVRALAERVDPGRLLRDVVAAATERAVADHGMLVGLLGDRVTPLVASGAPHAALLEAAGQAAATGSPARRSDPALGLEAVAVPVREGSRVIAALGVAGAAGGLDPAVLVPFADCAALALAGRPEGTGSAGGVSLAEALAAIATRADRDGVLRAALEAAESYFDARCAFVCLVEDGVAEVARYRGLERNRLEAAARHPDFARLVSGVRLCVVPPTDPVVGRLTEGAEFAVCLPLERAGGEPGVARGAVVVLVPEEPGVDRLAAFEAYRRQVAAALRASELALALLGAEEQVTAVVRAMPDPVLVVDPAGCFTALNAAAAELFALCEPFEVGRPARGRLGHPELEALLLGEADGPGVRGVPVNSEAEVVLGRPQPRRWRALARQLTPGGRLLVLTEVTRARSGEREESEFLAAVGRELRRPVAAIREVLGAASVPEAVLAAIGEEAGRLEALADQLALLGGGEITVHPEPADVVTLVGAVVAEFRALHPGRGLIVTTQPLQSAVDRRLFERALRPLLDNALRYSDGPVAVEVADRGESFEVAVVDAGPGIFSGDLPGLFERFHPLDGSPARRGAGLGLYTCRRLVEAMGGRIWCDSRLGVGSRFAFRLPHRTVEPVAAPVASAAR